MDQENAFIKKSINDYILANSQRYEIVSNLYKITEESYTEIFQQFKDHSKLIFKDHQSSIFFFYNIVLASRFNFKNLEIIMDICIFFAKEIKSTNTTDIELLSICHLYSNQLSYLFSKNFFSIESIVEKSYSNDEIFITFLPEIEQYDEEYAKIREKRLFQGKNDEKLKEHFTFVKSNPKQHFLYRQLNYHPSLLHKSIRDDDIETFQSLLSKNNYSINHHIEKSFYERLQLLLNKDLSLIQTAAIYGSIKVFKFLWFQKNIHFDDNLLFYAYCGCNFEIIHLCEKKCPLKNAYLQPIFIHRQDLLDYYIENFKEEIVEENEKVKNKLKDFVYDNDNNEDDFYNVLTYEAFSSALYSCNFDVIKPCFEKIIFILRNIEYVNGNVNDNRFCLLLNAQFDLELFKFLYYQRNENVDVIRCNSYFDSLTCAIASYANDAAKFLLTEIKEHCINALRYSLVINSEITNFIFDLLLNEKSELIDKMKKLKSQFCLCVLNNYNEDVFVKLIQLVGIPDDNEEDINAFIKEMINYLSTKMIMSLLNRLFLFFPKEKLILIANQFKAHKCSNLSDYILNHIPFN